MLGAGTWLAKSAIEKWLEQSVATFKERLRRESHEHSVRFERLHGERAEAMLAIWRAIRSARAEVGTFVSPLQSGDIEEQTNRGKEARKHVVETRKLVIEDLIFFPKGLAERLDQATKELSSTWSDAWIDYTVSRDQGKNPYMASDGKFSEFYRAWERISKDFEPVIEDIEAEFRHLLGVEDCAEHE